MSRIIKSFKCAIKGILYSIKNERNMRVHTVIAVYIVAFSFFFNLSFVKYSVLALVISSVFITEMLNSAIEGLLDIISKEYNSAAKIIKDIAAGAVLVASGFAVIVALLLFSNWHIYSHIWMFFHQRPVAIILFLTSVLLSYFYVFLGPVEIKNKIKNLISKN